MIGLLSADLSYTIGVEEISGDASDVKKHVPKHSRLYPVVGRLFKADVPFQDSHSMDIQSESNSVTKFEEASPEKQSNGFYFAEKDDEPIKIQQSFNAGELKENNSVKKVNDFDNNGNKETERILRRSGRSKGIIVNGIKLETDYYQDKIKKHQYEIRKKGVTRSNVKQKRMKRSEEYLKQTSNVHHGSESYRANMTKTQSTNEDIVNNNTHIKVTDDYSRLNRKDYAQKVLQKKVEALFDIESDKNSGLSDEEIEKSKLLRKQLLNFYIKGKQKKNAFSSLHNRSIQGGDEETHNQQVKDGKVVSPFDRMNINFLIDEIVDEVFGEENPNANESDGNADAEGRSRRKRLRRLAIPLLLALKIKTAILLPVIFGIVTLIAFKGLWAGMTSLGVVAILGLKSLIGQTKIYEVRAPHHYHYPPSPYGLSEIQYHHGFPEYWSRREDSYKPAGGWR
ncbi:uncharacterized protein LOC142317810 [Lycorma delicatula]|uniref:uncharacterized protein LOC142317810 n=1 Tax=Lycorma delicatula TaxID=130591 RepID=UPI003F5153D5